MNSPVEDRLRQALAEAGKTVDPGTLQPLRASDRRHFRVDLRMVAAAAAVVVVGSGTAVMVGGGTGGGERMTAAAPNALTREEADLAVFLCTATAPKDRRCQGAVTSEQLQGVEQVVARQTSQIAAAQWVSQASANDDFRDKFAGNQALLKEVEAADLPSSFLLKLREGADRKQVMLSFREVPGVMDVVDRASDVYGTDQDLDAVKWHVSAFLCKKGTALPACGGKRVNTKNGDSVIETGGKGATDAQKQALDKLIGKMPEVEEYVFEDESVAYKNFKEAYKSNKAIVEATRPEDLPRSFRIKLKKDSPWQEVVEELQGQPGVAQVIGHGCITDSMVLLRDFALTVPEGKVCATSK